MGGTIMMWGEVSREGERGVVCQVQESVTGRGSQAWKGHDWVRCMMI
jgi:hypothetical protein